MKSRWIQPILLESHYSTKMSGDSQHELRVLGLSVHDLSGFRSSFSRFAGLFVALDGRYDLRGFVQPEMSRTEFLLRSLPEFHPRKQTWVARAGLSPWAFRRRSEIAESRLIEWDGRFDVLFQLQTLFTPGPHPWTRPYVVYTDNIYPLVARHYPDWAQLGSRRGRQWEALERHTCHSARVVFTMGAHVREAIIEEYGCDPERVVAVGGGANLVTEQMLDKPYDRQIALFVGDKFAIKGGQTLLEAWELVHDVLPAAELWIIGPPKRHSPSSDRVRWFGYVADRAQLSELYRAASLFVLPSHFEAWGHAFLEAMAHGLACIGTDQFAMPEIISEGDTGFLVPPRSVDGLAGALIKLLSDPALARRMGNQAYESIASGGTWDHVAARMAPHIEAAAGSVPA
jgi:glycosyltransferase involved in cell wall biosynthesis